MNKIFRIGLDVGSTTAKIVMINPQGEVLYNNYSRHNADYITVVSRFFGDIKTIVGDEKVSLTLTGSIGIGFAEKLSVPFVQEVIAATVYAKRKCKEISTIIDIGGEDAKIVYFRDKASPELRMNGNCAGGTGAFIDQMAIILGVTISEMDQLAKCFKHIYPIASRCGVFSKTDVQNLISCNVAKEDIAASVFHAVAVQTVVTLSHGCEIKPPILLCGGPLTFIESLRREIIGYLGVNENEAIISKMGNLVPAFGAALYSNSTKSVQIEQISDQLKKNPDIETFTKSALPRLFSNSTEYKEWLKSKYNFKIKTASKKECENGIFLGIDSGSTTTKIVAINQDNHIVFSFYGYNDGDPVKATRKGLLKLKEEFAQVGIYPTINGSSSTGYGEELIKAAFRLDNGLIETLAHFIAAKELKPGVTFVLDIGGQDMKAIFIENGVITRIEINEACSSGCGSFLETFANTLDKSVGQFANLACTSANPYDLGTRCTVFMNSKVKQALREGTPIEDIASGLSFSVVKNCLYKVLKINDPKELGDVIMVQGGTMKNDSVVRALEKILNIPINRCVAPELMGAFGSALYARSREKNSSEIDKLLESSEYVPKHSVCIGCENNCYVSIYRFGGKRSFFTGNKCEKYFSNHTGNIAKGKNCYTKKYGLIFERENKTSTGPKIGIPRCLNMFEDYPFWHSLFYASGISVVLSDPSNFICYEKGLHSVMSDNICFPAKLVHSHIYNLIDKGVDRIFFPFVRYGEMVDKNSANSYNCPIVTGYSEVIKNAIVPPIPVDSPVISFKNNRILNKQCTKYLLSLGVGEKVAKEAVMIAIKTKSKFGNSLFKINKEIVDNSYGQLTVLLAGRPYHTDPLIQHKISEMLSDMGVNVISEDIVRGNLEITEIETLLVTQWTYINRILKAAEWVANQGNNIQFVELTSFGCGPDALLLDEIRSILKRRGKVLTILKVDDINNLGSIRLRVRSLIDSLRLNNNEQYKKTATTATALFTKKKKIIVPFFNDYISPLMPAWFKLAGYDVEVLPESDRFSTEEGLKFANNEVCYPATLIVGDIIKALKSNRYDPTNVAVAISQTGGQCRATNYISIIKKGLIESGFRGVPVVAFAMGNDLNNEQPGFWINWPKLLPITLAAILFSDAISKFYHAAVVREIAQDYALTLRNKYIEEAKSIIALNKVSELYNLLGAAASEFNSITNTKLKLIKVGIVGEIYLKFNSFAHKHVVSWLINNGFEVEPPILLDFFLQFFVNRKVVNRENLEKKLMADKFYDWAYSMISKQIEKANMTASAFELYTPFHNIFEEAHNASTIISLSVQFGEGWLLPGEVTSFARRGINNVISLQPFGCIANHIISKGVEKRIKTIFPKINMLSLDFDSGVSEINIINRLMLFTNSILERETAPV